MYSCSRKVPLASYQLSIVSYARAGKAGDVPLKPVSEPADLLG
jgi:hypothetical protein